MKIKKLFIFLTLLLSVFTLFACSNKTKFQDQRKLKMDYFKNKFPIVADLAQEQEQNNITNLDVKDFNDYKQVSLFNDSLYQKKLTDEENTYSFYNIKEKTECKIKINEPDENGIGEIIVKGDIMKILVVEDEKDLNNIITKHLKKNNFSVDSVFNGEEALEYLDYGTYDLIILDIMLPKVNGYEVIKKLRENKNETAVLMLTARDSIEDKIKGLDLGADDYLIKPFDFGELLARIRALVRRKYGNTSNTLEIDDLCIDIAKKTVVRGGKNIELTGKEYEVLEYLIQNKGHVLSRDKIRDSVWDYGYEGESNIIDVLIKNIRKKIDIGNSKQLIHTKRGLGYVLKEDE